MNTALLALALLAPADTPIEPIDSTQVQIVLNSDAGIGLCESLGHLGDSVTQMLNFVDIADTASDPGSRVIVASMLQDTLVAWAVDQTEDAYSPSAAFTPEAEEIFENFAADCAGVS